MILFGWNGWHVARFMSTVPVVISILPRPAYGITPAEITWHYATGQITDDSTTDIFRETAEAMFKGKIQDINALVDSAPTRGNPNEQNITRLFATIGFPDILSGVTWQRVGAALVKRKLRDFNEIRNRIVHGSSEHVTKQQVRNYATFWKSFGSRFDDRLRQEIENVTGSLPW
jgi:RiboL-PSP-HEPN